MGHTLHGCARMTPAVCKELQNSQKSVQTLAAHYNISVSTVRKWRSRKSVEDISQIVTHLDDFILAYNVGKRLSALKRITPFQFILKQYKENPKIFLRNPKHQLVGLNT